MFAFLICDNIITVNLDNDLSQHNPVANSTSYETSL